MIHSINLHAIDFLLRHPPAQAPGVSEFYEVVFKYWGEQIRKLQAERQARKAVGVGKGGSSESLGTTEPSENPMVIEIPDDDGDDLESLEITSLQLAEKGVVFNDPYYIADDDSKSSILGTPADERVRKIQALQHLAITFLAGKCLSFSLVQRKSARIIFYKFSFWDHVTCKRHPGYIYRLISKACA